jgi:transcriptional regulator with XRE-family HTH domain
MTNVMIPEWTMADRLRKSLDASGVSIGEMADLLMVSRNTIGNYLAGRTHPKRRYVAMWAMRTGVPVEWLVQGKAEGPDLPSADSRCTARAA